MRQLHMSDLLALVGLHAKFESELNKLDIYIQDSSLLRLLRLLGLLWEIVIVVIIRGYQGSRVIRVVELVARDQSSLSRPPG